MGLQDHPTLDDCIVFCGVNLESMGELCQEGERSGEGYQDEGRDSVYCGPSFFAINVVFDDLTGRFCKPLCGAHGY